MHKSNTGRKKEASKVKQTNKAKKHSTPKAVTFPRKIELPRVYMYSYKLYALWLATLLDSSRESTLALHCTSGASKVRRSGLGKPVLICILASSLCFTP